MRRLAVAGLAGAATVAVVSWAGCSVQPQLISATEGTTLCVPVNGDGEAYLGHEVFSNRTGSAVSAAAFVPDQVAGASVVGGSFVPVGEPQPGVGNDPALIPHGFTFEPVPPGERVILVLGVKLDDPNLAGQFTGGTLTSTSGGELGRSSTGYHMVPAGEVCDMGEE